jgi:hypothetical protein
MPSCFAKNVFASKTLFVSAACAASMLSIAATPAEARKVVTYYAPAVTYVAPVAVPPVTTYYAPTMVPATTYYAPAVAAPVVAAPVMTPVIPARQVIVRPKVYVRGQPVRNVLRAVTP